MSAPRQRWSRSIGTLALAMLLCGAIFPRCIHAITPDSPEVRQVLDKAFKFLEANTDNRLGGKCLIGLAFLKDGADATHPKVAEAVQSCLNSTKGDVTADIYSTGIAIIFLCSLDPSKYSGEIVKLRDSLEARQKYHGGWGYPDKETGDTSMTQYGILSSWEMSKIGMPPSLDSMERVANWLIRTQGPEGNWGYQGKEAERGEKLVLVKQDSARLGMSVAGLGCTYMVADLLKLSELGPERDAKLPPALRLVRQDQKQGAITNKVDARLLKAAQERGKSWMRKNYEIDPKGFTHYYLYALERYQSFLEAAEQKFIPEPKWYNDGYAYLKKTQENNGSWTDSHAGMEAVNTAFGVLFLLRSTKKAIEKSKSYGDGALQAGRGLPADVQAARIRAGRIVPGPVDASAKELIDILFTPFHGQFATVSLDVELLRDKLAACSAEQRAEQLARLRTLVESGTPAARLAAVKVLGLLRDLDSVPALILALSDADWRIAVAADESLQFLARQTSPSRLTEQPNEKDRTAAVARWKQWYLAIRPDAEFEN
jgi:hypothetical protein